MIKRNRTAALHFFLIAGVGFLFTLPVVIYGIPFQSDDGVLHSLWYRYFSEQLWAGDFYPRWLMKMNGGLGSPVFFYYPPVPYFFTSLLKPFFKHDPQGFHQLGLSASLALIASGLTAYFWLKNLTDRNAALIAALFYMTLPYHLSADLYLRGAFTEFWAFVWMPLMLLFTQKIINDSKFAIVGLAVSYALLIMTHLPTTLIFSIIPFAYALFVAEDKKRLKTVVAVAYSMLLGIALSAIYLFPAMTTQQCVFLDRMNIGFFSYKNWFLFSNLTLWQEDKLEFIFLVLAMSAIACFAFNANRRTQNLRCRRANTFWFDVAIGSVLMMTDLSRPVWAALPVLQKIQFPWRFNAVLAIAATALVAIALNTINKNRFSITSRKRAILFLTAVVWTTTIAWAAWRSFPETAPDRATINDNNLKMDQRRDAPEYRPRWSSSMTNVDWNLSTDINHWDDLLEREFAAILQKAKKQDAETATVNFAEGIGRAEIIAWKPREILLQVESQDKSTLNVSQFYFPYWTAHLMGEPGAVSVTPSQPDGLIKLSIPGGTHRIRLQLERSRPELIGEIISLSALAVTLLLAVYLCLFEAVKEPFAVFDERAMIYRSTPREIAECED
jgi:hypothetical protein